MHISDLNRWLDRSIEASWLAIAAGVQLAMAHQTWFDAYTQVPKVFLLRSVTLLLIAALVAKVALRAGLRPWPSRSTIHAWQAAANRHQARLALLAVAVITYATLLATALSPVPVISIAGADAGRDSLGLATFASLLVLFVAIATHLRSRAQVVRLLSATVGAAWIASLYGIGQHFGIDWFINDAQPASRATLTFGNPIFAGAVLTMTIPLSFVLGAMLRDNRAQIVATATLLAPQLTAAAFTLTRGAWLGIVTACVSYLIVLWWIRGTRNTGGAAVALGLSLAIALAIVAIPVTDAPQTRSVLSRAVSIPSAVSPEGGLSARYDIWASTLDVLLTSPWPDDRPELPDLSLGFLRPLIGYGPNTYTYTYPLSGDTLNGGRAEYAHNFVLETAVEIGIVGALAYVGLIAALAWVALRSLTQAKRDGSFDWRTLVLIGLLAALAGRAVEQMVGVARPPDLAISWILAGLVVALVSTSIGRTVDATQETPTPHRHALPLVGAGLLAIGLAFVWVEVVLDDARAARLSAQAAERLHVWSDAEGYEERLRLAIELSPGAVVARLDLADSYYTHAIAAADQVTQLELLAAALAETEAVRDRNPLDARAWARSIRIYGMLDSLLEDDFATTALEHSRTLSALYPGFWQPHLEAAAAFLLLQDPEAALDEVATAKSLDAVGPGIIFTEAMALLASGDATAAEAVASQLATDTNATALQMQAEFQRQLDLSR